MSKWLVLFYDSWSHYYNGIYRTTPNLFKQHFFFFGFPWMVVILEQIVSRFFLKNKIKIDKVVTIMAYIYRTKPGLVTCSSKKIVN